MLMNREYFINDVFDCLSAEEKNTIIRENALYILQKLSTRRKAQSQMIDIGVINHLVDLLKGGIHEMSEYSLESATALLMNLSLRKSGKHQCSDIAQSTLKVLTELMDHENVQVNY